MRDLSEKEKEAVSGGVWKFIQLDGGSPQVWYWTGGGTGTSSNSTETRGGVSSSGSSGDSGSGGSSTSGGSNYNQH